MVKAAAIQMVSSDCVSDNLLLAERLIKEASVAGAKLIALPENFAYLGNRDDLLKVREKANHGPIQDFLSEQARINQIYLVGGSIPLFANHDDKLRSALLVFNEKGQCVTRYDKIHLFDVTVTDDQLYHESKQVEPGDAFCVIESPLGKLGLSICYDIRFPELYRNMLEQGAQIFVLPSAFTAKTGQAHWEILLRARAIENLCYLIAPNQGGQHANGRETYGHSMIIDPWGNIISQLETGNGFVIAEIDIDHLTALRQTFPSIDHRIDLK